jgi:hypothetical protein
MRAYRAIRGTNPLILDLGTRRKSVTNFTLRPLFLREGKLQATKQEAGRASENFSAPHGRENSLSPTGIESRTLQSVVYLLYRCVIPVYEKKYKNIKRKVEEPK